MGFFDSLGKAMGEKVKEKAAKNSALKDITEGMGEGELVAFYKSAKRKNEFLAMANAKKQLKERYYYSDEDFRDL